MRIQNNIPALNTFRQMGINTSGTARALEKLSSGFRINRAGDDAAGLAISEKMRAQVRGLNRASANAQDGISLIQSAEGALQESQAILQRMRVLSLQAANDINQESERQAIQDEINQLTREIDRISATTEFNGMTILDGSLQNGMFISAASGFNISSLSIVPNFDDVTGASSIKNSLTAIAVTTAGVNYDMTFNFALSNEADVDGITNGLTDSDVAGTFLNIEINDYIRIAAGLTEDQTSIQVAINAGESGAVIAGNVRDALAIALGNDFTITATGARLNITHNFVGDFGADALTFELEGNATEIFTEGWSEGLGTSGTDVVIELNGGSGNVEFSEARNNNFLFQGNGSEVDGTTITLRGRDSIALLFVEDAMESADVAFSFRVSDAARLSGAIISIAQGTELTLQIGANVGYAQTMRVDVMSVSATSLGIGELSMMTHADAQNAVSALDTALQLISDQRAALGAVQNRLEHTIANLDTVAENLQESESRIRDVDIAKEMMNFTKFSILTQASQAMMAQANNLPQGVLQLLR